MKINVNNFGKLALQFKVKATDGRISWKIVSLSDIIERYVDEESAINEMINSVCNCCQLKESGFDPCNCGDAFWDAKSEDIEINLVKTL